MTIAVVGTDSITSALTGTQAIKRAFRRLQATDINDPQPGASEMAAGLDLLNEVLNGLTSKGIPTETRTITGNTISGDNKVTNILDGVTAQADISDLLRQFNLSGTGIPASTRIKSVDGLARISMTAQATVTGTPTITIALLPLSAAHDRAVVAMLAVRLAGDLGLPVPSDVASDAIDGWNGILAAYIPDKKAVFDRAIARPAGTWDANTDWVM